MRRPGSLHLPALGALALGGLVVGCGSPCDQLRDSVCDGGDAAYCAEVEEFLKESQVDGDGVPLEGEAREGSCRYILGNVEILHAYRFKAKERLRGEPPFRVLKNMKPEERKAWRAKHGIPEPKDPESEAEEVSDEPKPKGR